MAAIDKIIIKDAYDLINFYINKPRFKLSFENSVVRQGATWRRRPLKFYFYALTTLLPEYKRYYGKYQDTTEVNQLFERIWQNEGSSRTRLLNASKSDSTTIFSEEGRKEIEDLEKTSKTQGSRYEKVKKYESIIEKESRRKALAGKGKAAVEKQLEEQKERLEEEVWHPEKILTEEETPTLVPTPVPNIPTQTPILPKFNKLGLKTVPYPLTNFLKDVVSRFSIAISTLVKRYRVPVLTGVSAGVLTYFGTSNPLIALGAFVTGSLLIGPLISGQMGEVTGDKEETQQPTTDNFQEDQYSNLPIDLPNQTDSYPSVPKWMLRSPGRGLVPAIPSRPLAIPGGVFSRFLLTPWGWGAIIVVAIIAVMVLQKLSDDTYRLGISDAIGLPGYGGGGDIASCKFTQAGKQYSINSTRLISLIEEVAAASGVPSAVVASLAMHESPDFVANAENDHAAFDNAGFTGVACKPHFGLSAYGASTTGALGLMQVQPPARILNTYTVPDPNPNAYGEDGVRRGIEMAVKAGALPSGTTTENIQTLQFCDVRVSLYLGTGVLISKNGGKPPTTADEVKNSVCSYYGNPCTYGRNDQFNYGEEAKKDFLNCKSSSMEKVLAECPVPDFSKVVTSSYQKDPVHGHCGSKYGFKCQEACPTTGRRSKAIDIVSPTNLAVLPTISGQKVLWKVLLTNYDDTFGAYGSTFEAAVENDKWYLDVLHLNRTNLSQGGKYESGTSIATASNAVGHVHATIGKNVKEARYPAKAITDCDPGWIPSDDLCKK